MGPAGWAPGASVGRAQLPGTRDEQFRGRPETMPPNGARGPRADHSSQPWGGLPQISVSMGAQWGPGWIILVTPTTRSQTKGHKRAGAPSLRVEGWGDGLPTSEFLLLPAEDLSKLAQLLAGGLRLLLQPLVVLPQAGHLRLQYCLVLLLLLQVCVQLL